MASLILPCKIHHGLGTLTKLTELKGEKTVILTSDSSMVKTCVTEKVKSRLLLFFRQEESKLKLHVFRLSLIG